MWLHTTDGKNFYFGELNIEKIQYGSVESDGCVYIGIHCSSTYVPDGQKEQSGILCFRVQKEQAERFFNYFEPFKEK